MTPSRPARSARLCLQPWPPFQSHMRPPHGQSMRNHLVYVNVVNVRTMICNYGCTIKLRQPPMSEFFYDVLPIGRIFTHSQRYDSNLWFEKKPMEEMFWSHLLKVAWVWSLFWMICLNKLEAQNCTSMILMNLCVVVAPHQWHTWNSLNQYFKFDACHPKFLMQVYHPNQLRRQNELMSSKGSLVRKLPGYVRVMVSIPTIMSTTRHQVVGRCNSLVACEFSGANTLGRETLRFSWWSGFCGRRSRASVSAIAGFYLRKWLTKSAQDCSTCSISTSKCCKTDRRGALLEDAVGKMCTRL